MKTNLKTLAVLVIGSAVLYGCNSGGSTTSSNPVATESSVVSTDKYEVVIDSGSKGNRVYVYKYDDTQSLISINEIFEDKNSDPLANFATNPAEAGHTAILPLLDEAKEKLSKLSVAPGDVTATVMGTAGMRLISESSQEAIWSNVSATITGAGFKLGAAKTLDGQHEGIYTWIDYNYLNSLFGANQQTSGTIEIGGASAQIAYAMPLGAIDPNAVKLKINGNSYNVYGVSYLGLGVNQARQHADALVPNLGKNPCYANGYAKDPINGDFNFASCNANFSTVMNENPDVNNLRNTKTLPRFSEQKFAGLGAIWDSVQPLKKSVKKGLLASSSFTKAVQDECSVSYSDLLAKFTADDHAEDAPTYCSTAVYTHDFIFQDLGLQDGVIQGFNKFETDDGAEYKYNWTLGFLVAEHLK